MTSRRDFLQKAAALALATGVAPRIARADSSGAPLPAHDHSEGGYVSVPTMEHYGDVVETLRVPTNWRVTTCHMAGATAPVLSPTQTQRQIATPLGTKRLRDIARGKKTAVVAFDDITRATPIDLIMPHVVEELKRGGIRDENITLLMACGGHRPLNQDEVRRKLGDDMVQRFAWRNHNAFENLIDVGTTPAGVPLHMSQPYMDAQVKVTIGGIKAHPAAGYSGGAKMIMPGLASIESTFHWHLEVCRVAPNRHPTTGNGKIFKNVGRMDIHHVAKEMVGVDFTVQVVYNGYRQPIGVYSGDIVDAFYAGCRAANQLHRTELVKEPDIAIVNCYPLNMQAFKAFHFAKTVKKNGVAVAIIQNPQGMETFHAQRTRFHSSGRHGFSGGTKGDTNSFAVEQAKRFVVYSRFLQERDRQKFPAGTVFTHTWEDTVKAVKEAHKGPADVALYPYGGVQHPPFDLDEA